MGTTTVDLWHPPKKERTSQSLKITHLPPQSLTSLTIGNGCKAAVGKITKGTDDPVQPVPSHKPVFYAMCLSGSAVFFLVLASSGLYLNMLRLISPVVSSVPAESVRMRLFVGLGFHHCPCTATVFTDTKLKHQGYALTNPCFCT
jgi:hypothetical protein